jgi:hypothetical protein
MKWKTAPAEKCKNRFYKYPKVVKCTPKVFFEIYRLNYFKIKDGGASRADSDLKPEAPHFNR